MVGKIFVQNKIREIVYRNEEDEIVLKRRERNHQAFGGGVELGSSAAAETSGSFESLKAQLGLTSMLSLTTVHWPLILH